MLRLAPDAFNGEASADLEREVGLWLFAGIRHNRMEVALANLIIDMPDDLARLLEGIAAAQHISVEQLAVERLRSLVETSVDFPAGTAAAVLRAMRQSPHPSASDVAELEGAIATGRMPTQTRDPFSE
jgi:hypothetical protein